MNTPRVSAVRKHPRNRFRSLAGIVLSGAAALAPMPLAQASQAVAPFGIPCDSVGVSGIAYVPGVNCRLMVVDGYTRRYVVWVPLCWRARQFPGGVHAPRWERQRRGFPDQIRLA